MSRSFSATLTLTADASEADKVVEAFVRKVTSKPIAIPLTATAPGGGGGAGTAGGSPTTFANASAPGATPAAAVSESFARRSPSEQQIAQANENLAGAINQQASATRQVAQRLREPVVMGQKLTNLPPHLQAAVAAMDPASAAFLAQAAGVNAPVRTTQATGPGGGGGGGGGGASLMEAAATVAAARSGAWGRSGTGLGGLLGFGTAANVIGRSMGETRRYNIDSVLAGSDQAAQVEAVLKYREGLISSGMFVGQAVGFLQDPTGMGEAGVRATLASADAGNRRAAAMPEWRRATQSLRDQTALESAATPMERRMREADVKHRRELETIQDAGNKRARDDNENAETRRVEAETGRRGRAIVGMGGDRAFGFIASYGDIPTRLAYGGATADALNRRVGALATSDAATESSTKHEAAAKTQAAVALDRLLEGKRSYAEFAGIVRDAAPERATFRRIGADDPILAARANRQFQAASRMELQADIGQEVEGEIDPEFRAVRARRGRSRLDAFDAGQSFENRSALRIADLTAEAVRRATVGDDRGALESRQRVRRRRTLDAADFSTPESSAVYAGRRREDLAQEDYETRQFNESRAMREAGASGRERVTGFLAKGQPVAAQAESLYSRGMLDYQALRGTLTDAQFAGSGRTGEATSVLNSARNELAALKLEWERGGGAAEVAPGAFGPQGTSGNVALEDIAATMKSIDQKISDLQQAAKSINQALTGEN